MKLHHTAALALVGWYLMVPPPPNNDYQQLAPNAPISRWEQLETCATLRQCRNDIKMAALNDEGSETMADFGLFRCIASNDPRLKGD